MYKAIFSIEELLQIINGELISSLSSANKLIMSEQQFSISTDTRTITENDIYLALSGEVFDGHNFVKNAFEKGVKFAVIDEKHKSIAAKTEGNFLIVENTLEAYLKIANYHRNRYSVKIIGVTGSSGKTTTKEFLYSVFNSKFKTQKSIKNHNNEIGLCQTLLSIEPDTKYCIVEMGMRGFGEIDLLAKYARPDIAIITNAGTAHIGILGSRENIAKAKCEITNYFTNDGILLAHNEDLIKNMVKGDYKKIFYDLGEVKSLEKRENYCKFIYDNYTFELSDSADFNILNALAAIKAAKIENYTYDEIQKGLLKFKNVEFRNEITMLNNGAMVISDCYNANPSSTQAALRHICEIYKDKKIVVVFGDMLELGEFEEKYHRQIGKLINELNVNYFISVGKLAKMATEEVQNINKKYFETIEEAADFLPKITDGNTLIFLKASRGMKFEKILEIIRER